MTGQVADRVIYQGTAYQIVGKKGTALPTPYDFGISPRMMTTACWRGYICQYTVGNGNLLLTQLVTSTAGVYPQIDGIQPTVEKRGSSATYTNLALPAPFSGGLLIAKDFIQSLYVHMGFQKATSFEHVIELLFEEGKLTSAVDHSAKIAQARKEQLGLGRPGGFDDPKAQDQYLDDWIAYTFSLDYNV